MRLSRFGPVVLSMVMVWPAVAGAEEPPVPTVPEVTRGRRMSRGAYAMENNPKEIFGLWKSATERGLRNQLFTIDAGELMKLESPELGPAGGGKSGILIKPVPGVLTNAVKGVRKLPPELLTMESFQKSLKSMQVWESDDDCSLEEPKEGETGKGDLTTYYCVEEDLYLNELELTIYYSQLRSAFAREMKSFDESFISADPVAPLGVQAALRSATEDGRTVRWSADTKLSYCVMKWTFGADVAGYEEIRRNAELAAADWEKVCGVDFEYRPEYDNAPRGTSFPRLDSGERAVLFVITRRGLNGAVAEAFYPNEPVHMRILQVDKDAYAKTEMDKVGVFRHEFGHVLGLRHEHISPDAPAWFSSFCQAEKTVGALTDELRYDRNSVMHYPCVKLLKGKADPNDKVSNLELKITDYDKIGIRAIYGPPEGPRPEGGRFKDFGF